MEKLIRVIKYFTIIVGVAGLMMLMAGATEAATFTATGNPGDTLSGTVITAEATNATLDYTDINRLHRYQCQLKTNSQPSC